MNRWPVLRPDYELRGGLDVKYQDPVNRSEVSVYYLPTAAQRVHTCQFSISSSLVRRVILEEFRLKGSGLSVTRALQPIRMSQWIFRTKNPKSGCFVFLNEKLKISGWRASIDGVICPVQSNETNHNPLNAESGSHHRAFYRLTQYHVVVRPKAFEERGGSVCNTELS